MMQHSFYCKNTLTISLFLLMDNLVIWLNHPKLFSISYKKGDVMEFDVEYDACGLQCPMPIMKSKKYLRELSSGQVLHVIATDPTSKLDFYALIKTMVGYELIHDEKIDELFHYYIKRL